MRDPELANHFATCGRDAVQEGNHELAEQHLWQALEEDPYCAMAYNNLGALYSLHGMWQDAIDVCLKALGIDPTNPLFLFNAGTAFMHAGQLEQAIPYLKRAVSADPDYALAAFNLALCYDQLDQVNEALHWYTRSAKLDPTDPDPIYNIAEIHLRKKSFRRATRECQKALALCDAKFQEIQFSISLPPGESLTKEQLLAEVMHKKAAVHSLMALIYAGKRKPERALVAIQQAVELYPYNPDWFLFMSEAHQHLGNYVEARKAYLTAQQLRQNALEQ